MTGKTHREGGLFCALLGFLLLYRYNLLYEDVNYILQFLIIYPFALYGCVASDLDHHWESCPDRTIPSRIINMILHATTPLYKSLDKTLSAGQKKSSSLYKVAKVFSASHRSWQTHSDLTLICMLILLKCTLSGNVLGIVLSSTDGVILSLILTGLCLGVTAHFILDMLTPQGIWSILSVVINRVFKKKLPVKLCIVPKSKRFATGTVWEDFVRGILSKLTVVLAVVFIIILIDPSIMDKVFVMLSSYSIGFKN